jgi:hypothetical protein
VDFLVDGATHRFEGQIRECLFWISKIENRKGKKKGCGLQIRDYVAVCCFGGTMEKADWDSVKERR